MQPPALAPSASPTVSSLSKTKIVSYPALSPGHQQSAQAIVLAGLTDARVTAPAQSPLVAITLEAIQENPSKVNTNKYGKRVLCLDMGNDLRSLRDTLLPPRIYFPKPYLLNRRQLFLDEAYLHSTLSNWDGRNSIDKLMLTASAIGNQRSVAFTVRFGEKRLKSLGSEPASALRKIRNELSSLTSLGATLMTVELDQGGRLHLHGMVVTDASGSDIKRLLWALGGSTTNTAFRNRNQVKIVPATSPVCWAMYMSKELIDQPEAVTKRLIYMSQSATKLGREHLPELRDLAEQKLGIKPDWRGRSAVYSNPGIRLMTRSTTGMTRH
jgi:hypothetical protein